MKSVSKFLAKSFVKVEAAPLDPILGLQTRFQADDSPNKVNLGIGAYKDNEGNSVVLECVRKAEMDLIENRCSETKDYGPEDGTPLFQQLSREFLFGKECSSMKENRIASAQSISGSGGLFLAGDFLTTYYPGRKAYLPNPTWGNHIPLLEKAGLELGSYTYLDEERLCMDIDGAIESLSSLPDGEIVLFHGCCHNPTGVDPSHEDWDKLVEVCLEKDFIPFFDAAYIGFGSGDADVDAYGIRTFANSGIEQMIVVQSYSKNFGLYGERVGCVHFVGDCFENVDAIRTQVKKTARRVYSVPPVHGAKIVETILSSEELTALFKEELKMMSGRILSLRQQLYDLLTEKTSDNWDHIINQIGMFSYSGLTPEEVDRMVDDYHIYMTQKGRMSMCGLNDGNIEYVANAIAEIRN